MWLLGSFLGDTFQIPLANEQNFAQQSITPKLKKNVYFHIWKKELLLFSKYFWRALMENKIV